MKLRNKIALASVAVALPSLTFARGISDVLNTFGGLVAQVIPIIIGLAVAGFLWGLLQYLFGKDQAGAKWTMLWGIIILFVMVAVWGLVGLLSETVLEGNPGEINAPGVPR